MKHLFTLGTLLSAAVAIAQPNIEHSNFPTAAMNFSVYVLTDFGTATVPSDGANQTWDLTTATFTEMGGIEFRPAAGTPYATSYPDANWDLITTVTGQAADHRYLMLTATGLEQVAEDVPSSPNVFSDHQQLLAFPLAFGGSFTDACVSPDYSITETWTYSGHGTLITDFGTFPDQIKMVGSDDDLIIWNASPLFPRAIEDDDVITLLVEEPAGIHEETKFSALHTAPNPVTNSLRLVGVEGAYHWFITDVQGRLLLNGSNSTSQAIDVSSLATGSYLLEARDGETRRTVRFNKW